METLVRRQLHLAGSLSLVAPVPTDPDLRAGDPVDRVVAVDVEAALVVQNAVELAGRVVAVAVAAFDEAGHDFFGLAKAGDAGHVHAGEGVTARWRVRSSSADALALQSAGRVVRKLALQLALCSAGFPVQRVALEVADDFAVQVDLVQMARAVELLVELLAVGQHGLGAVAQGVVAVGEGVAFAECACG